MSDHNSLALPDVRVASYTPLLRRRVIGVGIFAVFAVVVAYCALNTVIGQGIDTMMMESLGWSLRRARKWGYLAHQLVSVLGIVVAMGVIGLIAFLRRRCPLAIRAIALIVCANVMTQLLKYFLVRADVGLTNVFPNSLPSGHVTVTASVAAALVMVAPTYWRSVAVWLGWFASASMGVMVVAFQWHRVSDAIVAMFIVGVFALGLSPVEVRSRHFAASHRAMSLLMMSAVAVALLCVVVAVIGVDLQGAASFSGSGYGFLAYVKDHPVRRMILSVAAVLLVCGVAAALMHELDRLSGPFRT